MQRTVYEICTSSFNRCSGYLYVWCRFRLFTLFSLVVRSQICAVLIILIPIGIHTHNETHYTAGLAGGPPLTQDSVQFRPDYCLGRSDSGFVHLYCLSFHLPADLERVALVMICQQQKHPTEQRSVGCFCAKDPVTSNNDTRDILLHQLIRGKGRHISQHHHIAQLHGRPHPAFGFALSSGQRTHAHHSKHIKYQQRPS